MRFSDGILDEVPLSLDGTRAMVQLKVSGALPQDRGELAGALVRGNRGYYDGDLLRLLYLQVPDVQRPQPRYALYTLVLDPGSRLPRRRELRRLRQARHHAPRHHGAAAPRRVPDPRRRAT